MKFKLDASEFKLDALEFLRDAVLFFAVSNLLFPVVVTRGRNVGWKVKNMRGNLRDNLGILLKNGSFVHL